MLLVHTIEDGRYTPDVENINIVNVVTDLLQAYRLAAEEKGIRIHEILCNLNETASMHYNTLNPALGVLYHVNEEALAQETLKQVTADSLNHARAQNTYVNHAFIRM